MILNSTITMHVVGIAVSFVPVRLFRIAECKKLAGDVSLYKAYQVICVMIFVAQGEK